MRQRRSAPPSSDFGRASTVVTQSRIMDLGRGMIPGDFDALRFPVDPYPATGVLPMLPGYPSSQTDGTFSVCTSSLMPAALRLRPFPATISGAPSQTVGSSSASSTSSLSPAPTELPPFPATIIGAPSLPKPPCSLPVPLFYAVTSHR